MMRTPGSDPSVSPVVVAATPASSIAAALKAKLRTEIEFETQRTIAGQTGIDHAVLSRWLTSERCPDAVSIDRLLDWLGIRVKVLALIDDALPVVSRRVA